MFRNSFEKLSNVQKVQMYLLVPMFFWLLLFAFESRFSQYFIPKESKKVKINNKLDSMKIVNSNSKEIVYFLENKLELYDVTLKNLKIDKNTINLELLAEDTKLIGLLQKLQIHLQILSFKFIKKEALYHLQLLINTEYLFNKSALNKEFLKRSKKPNTIAIKIDAIIDNEVLLNGKWYKKTDTYKEMEISQIKKNYIYLKDIKTNKIIKVELLNESL